MNNNESFNMSRGSSPDLPDADCAMTAEELALYREVLESAYPKPKRDIKAGVMTAVRRDAALKKKRAANRSLFMKWGGLAACIALIAAVSIRVLPSFLSDGMVEYEADAAPMEQAETEAGESTVLTFSERMTKSGQDSVGGTGSADGNSAADDAADDSDIPAEAMYMAYSAAAPEAEEEYDECIEEAAVEEEVFEDAVMEAPAAEEYCEPEEAAAEEAVIEEAPASEEIVTEESADAQNASADAAEENVTCSHIDVFADSYHTIPYELAVEVGKDAFLEWENAAEASADPCARNIRAFIDHFGYSKEAFGVYLTTTDAAYFYDYPLDILYGDAETCESYYSNGGDYEKMLADRFEYSLKLALTEEIDAETYEEWLKKFPYPTVRAWSISEFVNDHGIPEPRFNEICESAADAFKEKYGVDEVHGYDTVKLYVNALGIKLALASSQLGYYADVSCRK